MVSAQPEVAAEQLDLRRDVDDDVAVEHEHLRDARVGVQQLLHRRLVERVPPLDARVERPAVRRIGERPALGVHIGRGVEVELRICRLAADLRPDGVVVHERRVRPGAQERDVAIVAAPAALHHLGQQRVGRPRMLGQRRVLRPDPARHVVRVQRPRRCRCRSRRPAAPRRCRASRAAASGRRGSVGGEVGGVVRPLLARMAAGAVVGEDLPPLLDRAVEELRVERDLEVARRAEAARPPEVGRPGAEEERLDVVQPVLDRPERGRSRAGTGRCRTGSGRSCAGSGSTARRSGRWLIQHCSAHDPMLK